MRGSPYEKLKRFKKRGYASRSRFFIRAYSWPTISLAGKKASANAWLLAQHADKDQKFQQTVLKLLKNIDKKSGGLDIDRANIAYLTDRLLVKQKMKQQFGTQFDFDKSGRLVLHPMKNPKVVDELRKGYNLPPLKKFIKMAEKFNAKLKIKIDEGLIRPYRSSIYKFGALDCSGTSTRTSFKKILKNLTFRFRFC